MNQFYLQKKGFSRILVVSIITIVAVYILFFQSKNKETIKIGAILSLTGTGSHLVDLRDAMVMATKEINFRGGINGREIELLVEDSKTNPNEAIKAFERLEQGSKKPVIYISTNSSIGKALAPLAAQYKVVLVGANTPAPEFITYNDWVFRHFFYC